MTSVDAAGAEAQNTNLGRRLRFMPVPVAEHGVFRVGLHGAQHAGEVCYMFTDWVNA